MSTTPERPDPKNGDAYRTEASRPSGSAGAAGGKKKRRRKNRNPVLVALGWVFKILGTLLLVVIVTGCFVACYSVVYIQTVIMPEAAKLDLDAFVLNEPSTIYYTDRETGLPVAMATCVGAENRVILEPNEIPEVFRNVAIAAEDKRFLNHKGVDWIRTGAAVIYMFTGQDIQGGSTITQQVIKNYTQEDEVTVKRKVLEIFRALSVEDRYSKDDILAMYLNYIYLGGKQYGIAAAARYYFDKDVSEITLAEAASIIAITNNPSLYGPYSTVETTDSKTGRILTGIDRNKIRQENILYVMCYDPDIAMITEEEYKAAIAQPLNFVKGEGEANDTDVNPWYVDEVISELVKHFISEGYTKEAANQLVYGGGLHIYTPFDPSIQAHVDAIYTDTGNLPYTSKDGQQLQSCITIVDNETGYVVAMAGQMGEKTGNRWWNFATDSTRQPGSSIKPLAAYSPAIEMGLVTPYTVIDDSPYSIEGGRVWPRNDNGRYRGLSTVLQGITSSTNTIASKLVGNYVTPDASYHFLEDKYGLTTLEDCYVTNSGAIKDDIGVAQLALGGLTHGLSPYEMTAAYATFPRGGAYTAPTVILRVENRDHQLIWDNSPETTYPIKDTTAHYMNVLLSSAIGGTGNNAINAFGGRWMHLAGKTGTTTDNYDRWFAGYTPYYTAVVWTGYQRNAKITGTDGNPAARLWGQVMKLVHEGLEDKPFFSVSNVKSYSICLDCGQLATDACVNDTRGSRSATYSFVDGTQPKGYCTCHVPITVCTESPILKEDGTPIENLWHLAGEFCPEESIREVYIVDYHRDEELCGGLNIEDRFYMTSFYETLEVADCDVHTEAPADPENPNDPNDPNAGLNPGDPGYVDPNTPSQGPDDPGYVDPNDPDNPYNTGFPGNPGDPTQNPSQQPDPSTSPPSEPSGWIEPPPPDTPPVDSYIPVG